MIIERIKNEINKTITTYYASVGTFGASWGMRQIVI
jgi:hypothetical protein